MKEKVKMRYEVAERECGGYYCDRDGNYAGPVYTGWTCGHEAVICHCDGAELTTEEDHAVERIAYEIERGMAHA